MLWHNLPQRETNSRQEQNKRNLHTQTAKSSPFGKENKEARQQERKSARYISNSAPQRTKVSECKHPTCLPIRPKVHGKNVKSTRVIPQTSPHKELSQRVQAPHLLTDTPKGPRQKCKKHARNTPNFAP